MTSKHYEYLKGIAALITIGGVISLLSHLAGQITVGFGSAASLAGGGIAIVLGIFLYLLAIGVKASR